MPRINSADVPPIVTLHMHVLVQFHLPVWLSYCVFELHSCFWLSLIFVSMFHLGLCL